MMVDRLLNYTPEGN